MSARMYSSLMCGSPLLLICIRFNGVAGAVAYFDGIEEEGGGGSIAYGFVYVCGGDDGCEIE